MACNRKGDSFCNEALCRMLTFALDPAGQVFSVVGANS